MAVTVSRRVVISICSLFAGLSFQLIGGIQFSHAAMTTERNRAISYLTSWELANNDAITLQQSKIDTLLLSFGKWNADGSIETSDNIASAPEYNAWWMPPAYMTWTQLKQANPEKKMMLAFGGQTYESIWPQINTPEKRAIVAQNLASLLKIPFPVYKKNMKPNEMSGECLNWNWNHTECDMSTYQKAGNVYLDGIDFDFEKASRLTEQENNDLLELAKAVRQQIGKDKLLSLTTYHVGADPVECGVSSVIENCSYVENARSSHHGEVLPLLKNGKDVFDFFNVMAYDAGKNFQYKTAMANYARAVGNASKIILGTTINSQWGPEANFVETKENNLQRARWQKEAGYGGFFVWTLGSNTQGLTLAEQVAYLNEMKVAADSSIATALEISSGKITFLLPQARFRSNSTFTVYHNGQYQASTHSGESYSSTSAKVDDGREVIASEVKTIKPGDIFTLVETNPNGVFENQQSENKVPSKVLQTLVVK